MQITPTFAMESGQAARPWFVGKGVVHGRIPDITHERDAGNLWHRTFGASGHTAWKADQTAEGADGAEGAEDAEDVEAQSWE